MQGATLIHTSGTEYAITIEFYVETADPTPRSWRAEGYGPLDLRALAHTACSVRLDNGSSATIIVGDVQIRADGRVWFEALGSGAPPLLP